MSRELEAEIQKIVQMALQEDMPAGDITTEGLQFAEKKGRARLVAKEDLVLSGVKPFAMTFKKLDPKAQIGWQFTPGQFVFRGQTICTVSGQFSAILSAERTALNFLGRLSGVASLTRCFVEQVRHTRCKILDTRKTTPLLRVLEKAAVVDGGGHNHRMGLSDAILVKENHIQAGGGITAVVEKLKNKNFTAIEVEVRNQKEIEEAIKVGASRLLLDNMSNDDIREALKLVPGHIQTEASGNMTLARAKEVAELGVDFISVGALTHSAPCADVSLLIE